MDTPRKQTHLFNIINTSKCKQQCFVLFLGAGASKNSDVKIASEMINEWRDNYCLNHSIKDENKQEFLNNQPWYKANDEYSQLFELVYDEPSQRREYIESCLEKASPSWGYIYLVNLLKEKVFNTVFTTNFDDLLNEACYQYSGDVRPIVCAHDSSINSIRITSSRPKIIKLHGDFLFDNIKNTIRETESLEINMREKFKQYASEFGFIVLGYSGTDRSVMDAFTALLKNDNNFPHGIYWCVRDASRINSNVSKLLRFPKVKLVEMQSFDEFFAELHEHVDLHLQEEMSDPYSALAKKLNNLTKQIKLTEQNLNTIIKRDINNLAQQVQLVTNAKPSESNDLSVSIAGQTEKLTIPYGLLAESSARNSDFDSALLYRFKELNNSLSSTAIVEAFRAMYLSKDHNTEECKLELFKILEKSEDVISKNSDMINEIAVICIENIDYIMADKVLNLGFNLYTKLKFEYEINYYLLNKLQIFKHQNIPFDDKAIELLKKVSLDGERLSRIGAHILLDEFDEAEKLIKEACKGDLSLIEFTKTWPIMKFVKGKFQDLKLNEFYG